MIVYVVNIFVKPGYEADFITATRKNHEMTRKEPGNLRFDCLKQAEGDAGRFLLYEAYTSQEAVVEHKKTPHYLEWKKSVEAWMSAPRQGVLYEVVCPEEGPEWES
jgi:(4S)-4-hydroxy-5-phosphonooxypentane-2,3-dione isomerase